MKRLFDILVASLGLMMVWPVILLAAIAVRITTPGPAFFLQERVGKEFKPFRIIKLRTMVATSDGSGPLITAGGDRRVTAVGSMLRDWKIDELPQLINVIKGDMSLVGPRPEVLEYVNRFREDYSAILTVRPGLTDPASLKYANESDVLSQATDPVSLYIGQILPDKLALAKEYVRNTTLTRDIALIYRTLVRIAH